VELGTAQKVTFGLVCAILEHFRLKLTLNGTFFGGFCWTACLFLMRDEQAVIDRLFHILLELIDAPAPVIDLNRINELVVILQLSIKELNVAVLTLLAKLRAKTSSSATRSAS
jgi:hypothetical protein